MKKILNNIVIYFNTIIHPRLVVDLANKCLEAHEMVKQAYKLSSEMLELSTKLYDKTMKLDE